MTRGGLPGAKEGWQETDVTIATVMKSLGYTHVKKEHTGISESSGNFHHDGTSMLDYFAGKVDEAPQEEFVSVGDDGQIIAMRYADWKAVFREQRVHRFKL